MWRYASTRELLSIVKAGTLLIIIFYSLFFLMYRLEGIPRSVPIIHWFVLMAFIGGPRFLYRIIVDRQLRFNFTNADRTPVLLMRMSETAELFLRESTRNPSFVYRVAGILDDDKTLHGKRVHGIKVYGSPDSLERTIEKLEARGERPERIVVGTRLEGNEMRHWVDQTSSLSIPLARIPSIDAFQEGELDKLTIRPINIEDLLGRPPHVLDHDSMRKFVEDKVVLISGAGGSIGSELARQVAAFAPETLILLDHSEFNLYNIDQEMANLAPGTDRHAVLCNVRNQKQVDRIIGEFAPDIVFHAAAIKHVPIAEDNPEETMLTNVFGTKYVADACITHKIKTMVFVSTDKAVNPTNVMGACKRLAELYCQAAAEEKHDTHFITVRFGNVLGSTGSVVPLFQKQLEKGGPITITHPDITRYFMTIREAVELVIQAASMGAGEEEKGQVYVLDMGQPIRIRDLAAQMIKLAGLSLDEDITIEYTGLRPGEKLYEELFYFSEGVSKTQYESIMQAKIQPTKLRTIERGLNKLQDACEKRDRPEALVLLHSLVPEYEPQ
jgi:O-antigen biosynthesis protein WbqV